VIAQVDGTVAALRLDAVVVAVGGVGLLVHATPDTLATLRPGGPARLATSLVVREDALTLYGFVDDDARDTFELLQTVSGVGPRLALAVLAVHAPASLRQAVAAADVDALVRVPGIGRKGAQRILLELADRLVLPPTAGQPVPAAVVGAGPVASPGSVRGQVVTALTGLGWTAKQAEEAVAAVTPDGGANGVGADGVGADGVGADGVGADGRGADGRGADGAGDASEVLRAALRRLGRS
jgi:holliday junction DNA helicase RuvA